MNQTKSTSKKLLALLLALIMTVSLLPMSVFAAELGTDEPAQGTEEVIDVPADGEDAEDVEPADGEGDVTLPEEPAEDAEPEEDVTLPGDEETPDEALLAAENGIAVQAITITDKPADGTTKYQPFISGQTGGEKSKSFRIPAMVTLNNGTIVASADARWDQAQDGGGNDTIVAYSSNDGNNWNYTFANYLGDNGNMHNDASTCFIDPALATDGTTVYMLTDLFPHGRATFAQTGRADRGLVAGSGFTSDGYLKLSDEKGDNAGYLTETNNYNYYLKDHLIYSSNGTQVSGYWVDDYFNIYTGNDETGYLSNLFFADSPYRVYPTGYLYLTKSTDGGASWSTPTLINPAENKAFTNEIAYIVGPGRGTVTSAGTIIFPVYGFIKGQLQVGFVYSTDKGKTWTRSNSGKTGTSESDVVELSNGTLRVFYRSSSGSGIHYMDVTKSDEGYKWGSEQTVTGATSYSDCQLSAIKYSKKVGGHETIIVSCPTSGRTNGYLYLLDAETMTVLASRSVYTGNYQYSSLTELNNGNIGLLYETHANSASTKGTIQYATYDPSTIFSGVKFDASTTDPGKTDPGTSETPATGETIVIKVGVGQTVKKTYDFDADVTVKDGSYNDDYCDVTWTANKVAGGTTVDDKATSPASGTAYLISDGTNYLTVDASGNLGNTTDEAKATQWTYSNSRFSATVGNTTYYLQHSNNSLTVDTSTSNATWTVNSNGIYYTTRSGRYTYYYLSCNSNSNNEWSVVSNATQSARGYTYSFTTNAPVNEAELTVKGNARGESEAFQIGNKKFRVEVVDGYLAEVAVGGTATISLSEANVTLQEGQTVVWTVGDDGKYAGIYSQDGTNATLTGREETPDSTTTIATATVKNADGTVAGTYNWLVTVTEGTKPNAGNYEVAYDITNTVYNGKLYYSVSGSPLKEATPDGEPTTDEYGNTIRKYTISETETGVAYSQLELFVAPDEGYAVSKIAASTTAQGSQFYGLNKSEYTAIYDEENHKGGKLESVLTEGQVKSLIKEAVDAGCDAVLWYSRGDNGNKEYHTDPKGPLTKNDSVTATLYYYCDKMPTIDKEISHLIMGGKVVDYTADGMVADAGDQVVFKITVTCYPEKAAITYTNGSLNDKMANIQLYSDAALTTPLANPYNITAALDADRVGATQNTTHTYYAAYTLTPGDLQEGRKLENTVDLTYNYKSTYSTGTYGGASEADATFQLTDFPQINDIVVDFGLPVTVLNGVKWAPSYVGTISVKEATALYGVVKATGDNKDGLTVIYTPNTMTREIDTVTLTSSRGNTSTFRVIPASTVYYEDSFAQLTNGAGAAAGATWRTDGTTANENQQLQVLGSKEIYGYDEAYENSTTFSMGSAQMVTVYADMAANWDTDANSAWPTATFTFKGTGFDVISLTDNTSGAIFVDVVHKNGGVEKKVVVDNYYGYKQNENGEWGVDNESSNCLYQIPVIKVNGLPYDEYTVTIKVAYNEYFDHTTQKAYSFWLDAIRVYDPMGKDYEDYTKDGEGYPQYIKLRDELANSSGVTAKNNVVFIDGADEATVEQYKNYGPNNEVYLAKGQAITFKVPVNEEIATVQIGAKMPAGTGCKMSVNDEVVSIAGSATEMYYDITTQAKDGQQVTITNTGESILSLTNLKITFTEKQNTVTLATLSAEDTSNAVAAVRALFAAPVEPDPEPVVFMPERFEASWSRSTVKVGQKATLTVKTSEDVDAITVDGVTIDTYRTRTQRTGWGWNAKRVTYREFTYTITAKEAGTLNCSIAALNAENVASEPITAALTVQAAAQRPSWGGWLGNLFGRWF